MRSVSAMKRILLTAVVAIATTASACAYDLCGYNVGFNPNFNQNQIGLRFRYRGEMVDCFTVFEVCFTSSRNAFFRIG